MKKIIKIVILVLVILVLGGIFYKNISRGAGFCQPVGPVDPDQCKYCPPCCPGGGCGCACVTSFCSNLGTESSPKYYCTKNACMLDRLWCEKNKNNLIRCNSSADCAGCKPGEEYPILKCNKNKQCVLAYECGKSNCKNNKDCCPPGETYPYYTCDYDNSECITKYECGKSTCKISDNYREDIGGKLIQIPNPTCTTNHYSCNTTTNMCYKDKNGYYGSYLACQAACSKYKYACDTKKHTCYLDFNGSYDSSATCSQECSLYKCDTTTYQCIRDNNKGTYTGISQCLDNCKAPSKYTCDTKNHTCYLDLKGSYDSSAACYQECALYKCDTTTYQCIQDNKNGTYTGLSQCSDNCKKPNPQEPILVGYRCNKDICTEDKESGLKSCTCQAVYDNDEWYKTHPNSPLLYNKKSQCESQCYILPPATDCSIHWFDLDPQNVSIYSLWKQGKIPRMTWYAPNCDYCTLDVTYRSIWDKDKSVKTLKSDPQLFKDILDPYYPDLSLQFPKLGHYLPINSDQLRDYFKNDDNYKGNRNIYNVFQNSLVNPDDPPIKNKKEGVYTYTLTCSNNTNHTSDTLSQVVNIFPYIIWREIIPVLPKELGYEMDLKTPYNPALHPEEQQIHNLYNLDK